MNPIRILLAAGLALASMMAPGIPLPDRTAEAAPGKVEELRIASDVLKRERTVWVYTPPGYASSSGPCDLLIVFDGREYLEDIALPRILDTLLTQKKAGPFVALLIDNSTGAERLGDLANRARFADFLAGEAVDWVRKRYRVSSDPHRAFVTGSSAGGLAAAYVAFRRPDVFGNVLSQSGAFWRGNEGSNEAPFEWLTGQVASSAKKDVRFLLEVGSRESAGALGGAAPSILEANRRLRDALRAKGYSLDYREIPDGTHSPETWGKRLPEALAALAGSASLPGPAR